MKTASATTLVNLPGKIFLFLFRVYDFCLPSSKRQTIINEGKSSVLNDSNPNLSDKASKKVGNFFNNLTSLGGDTKEKVKLKVKPQQLKSMRKKLHRTPTPQPATDDVVLSRHFSQSCE